MTNLTSYKNDGIEIYIDNTTGESFCSLSGYSRMSGVNKSTITRRVGTVADSGLKTVEIPTTTGLRTVALISEDTVTEWLPGDNPAMATKLMKLGVRVFLHELAGYKVTSNAVVKPLTNLQALAQVVAAMVEQEERLSIVEQKNHEQDTRLRAVEYHTTGYEDYCSLKAYVNLNNIVMGDRSYSAVGKALVKLSKVMGLEVEKVSDARYGKVNTYAIVVLDNYFTGE